jgi:hypothetical protein
MNQTLKETLSKLVIELVETGWPSYPMPSSGFKIHHMYMD